MYIYLDSRARTFRKNMSFEEHNDIGDVMSACTHDISAEVKYKYLKPKVVNIFPEISLQRTEAGNKANYDTMVKLCDYATKLCKSDFRLFVQAIMVDHAHVGQLILKKYREKTGRELLITQETETAGGSATTAFASLLPLSGSYSVAAPTRQPSVPTGDGPAVSNQASANLTGSAEELGAQMSRLSLDPGQSSPQQSAKEEYEKVDKFSISEERTGHQDYMRSGLVGTESNPSLPTESLTYGSPEGNSQQRESLANPTVVPSPHQARRDPGAQQNRASLYERKNAEDSGNVYQMNTMPRGLVLVINNVKFQHFRERTGSDADQARIFHMFRNLGFKVSLENNKTTAGMKKLLELFARYEALSTVSALAVVILTHGTENDYLFGTDGKLNEDNTPVFGTYITKSQLGQFFTRRNCPLMEGKPKLFILQACRGELEDTNPSLGNSAEESLLSYDHPNSSLTPPKIPEGASASPNASSVRAADTGHMCFLHSSSSGYRAYRARSRGSPFLEVLARYVEEYAGTMEFRDIVQEVQKYFDSEALPNDMMTMPDLTVQLLKKWYLNPPPLSTIPQ